MAATASDRPICVREPRPADASSQDSLAARYPAWVRWLVMAAFTLAFLGWLNESWLFLWDSPIWLNRYTEYAIILAFGIWRIRAERNRYTRKRLIILVSVVTVLWWLIPWLTPFFEPYVGFLWAQPVFPGPAYAGDPELRPGPDPGLPVRAPGHLRLRLSLRRDPRDRRLRLPRTHPARALGVAPAACEVALLCLVRGGDGRDPVPAQRLDGLPGGRLRDDRRPHLFRQLLPRAADRQPLLLPLPVPLRRHLRAPEPCRLLRGGDGPGALHRLPPLRAGLRHGHPGLGAGQDPRADHGPGGLHGLRPLRRLVPHRCPGHPRCAQPLSAWRAARCQPAAGGAAGSDRRPRAHPGAARRRSAG